MWEELEFQIVLDNLAKNEFFNHESKEFVHMKQEILEVLPSIFFTSI